MAFRNLTNTLHHTVYPAISPENPANSAKGKTVVISGGASGISFAIGQSFAAAGAATVVIIARRQEALDQAANKLRAEIAAAGGKTAVWTYLFDTTNQAAVEAGFEDIRKRLNEGNAPGAAPKDATVLVTGAAASHMGKTTLEFSPDDFRSDFETNFYGNLNLARAFLKPEIPAIPLATYDGSTKEVVPSAHPHNHKVILDITTVASYAVAGGQTSYGVSKLANTRAMQQLQAEVDGLPGSPIRIHSFHPGIVYTPGVSKVFPTKIEAFPWDDESLPGGFALWLTTPAAAFLKGRFVFSNWDVDELIALKSKYEEDPEFGTVTLKF